MNRNYFLTGITELLILTILKHQDSYAYEITKIIQQESLELISISHATIYTAIYKLEKENYISEYSRTVGKKRVRVYYHLEQCGLEYLEQLSQNSNQLSKGVSLILESLNQ